MIELSLQKFFVLLKSTFESSSDGILVINNNGKIIDHNQELVDMFPSTIGFEAKAKELFDHIISKLENSDNFIQKTMKCMQIFRNKYRRHQIKIR